MAHKIRRRTKRVREEAIGRAGFETAVVTGPYEAVKTSRKVASTSLKKIESIARGIAESGAQCPYHYRRKS